MLLALRESFPTKSPGRQWDSLRWRKAAIDAKLAEREKERGSPLPEKNRSNAKQIIQSLAKFEAYVGSWLTGLVEEPNAGKVFRKLAGWLDAIDRLEETGIPENYLRFFVAVEEAAKLAGGIPSQLEVRTAFKTELSANQLGQSDTSRSLMKKLKFSWLPIAGRGPGTIRKKSGI